MRIYVTSIFVDDQDKALAFYTDMLGFRLKNNVPVGEYRWLTVVSKDQPDGTELMLEPSHHRAVGPYRQALYEDGIPAASFQVDDLDAEFARLDALGVRFTLAPIDAGPVRVAVLDDTCGNLVQLMELTSSSA